MGKRGIGLYATPVEWPALLSLRPDALVCLDAYHLPPYPSGGCQYLWRPWVPGTMRGITPVRWRELVRAEWSAKGESWFDYIQFSNEPNLQCESGYPDGSRAAAEAAVTWGRELIPLLRATWPQAQIVSPPLSPGVEPYLEFWRWLEPLVRACDVLGVHRYLDNGYSLGDVHRLYPDRDMVVTELGRPAGGTVEYARELLDYWRALDELPYVRWAAVFQWQVVPEFAAWGVAGTAAARVLAAAAE